MFVFQAYNGAPHLAAQHTATNGAAAKVVATTPTILAKQGVIVQSIAANTLKVNVGDSTVTATTGIELAPGDSIMFPIADPSLIYSWGVGASQILRIVWV